MKAILKPDPAPGLVVADVDEPEIRSDEVLIEVRRAGICGTDLHIYQWDEWSQSRIKPPLVIGHEFMGEVVEIGSLVGNVSAAIVSCAGRATRMCVGTSRSWGLTDPAPSPGTWRFPPPT
jgi:threonine dehydrogenase-like Zn-dependent dehydrogenase